MTLPHWRPSSDAMSFPAAVCWALMGMLTADLIHYDPAQTVPVWLVVATAFTVALTGRAFGAAIGCWAGRTPRNHQGRSS